MSSEDNQEFIPFCVQCPHCNDYIYIEKLNCSIFRHGVIKSTNKQIDPHLSKEICEKLVKKNLIYGCGKPFKIENVNNVYTPVICDYI